MSPVSRSPGVHSAWLWTTSLAKALVYRACIDIATACIVYLLISPTFPQLCPRDFSTCVFFRSPFLRDGSVFLTLRCQT